MRSSLSTLKKDVISAANYHLTSLTQDLVPKVSSILFVEKAEDDQSRSGKKIKTFKRFEPLVDLDCHENRHSTKAADST